MFGSVTTLANTAVPDVRVGAFHAGWNAPDMMLFGSNQSNPTAMPSMVVPPFTNSAALPEVLRNTGSNIAICEP